MFCSAAESSRRRLGGSAVLPWLGVVTREGSRDAKLVEMPPKVSVGAAPALPGCYARALSHRLLSPPSPLE